MQSKNGKKYQYVRIIGIILFIYILSKINFRELFSNLRDINPFYLLTALILLPFSFIFGTLKWKILVSHQGFKISFKRLGKIFLKGFFLGTITPGKLGEFWKAKYLANVINISGGKALYTVFADRLADVIIAAVIGTAGILTLLLNKIKINYSVLVLLFALVFSIFYFLTQKKKSRKIFELASRIFIPASLRQKTKPFLNEFLKGLEELNFILFLKLMGYGFLYYSITIFIYYFLALAMDLAIPFFYFFSIIAVIQLLVVIPITFLGLGTREAGYIFFFAIFNISAPQAVAFSLLTLLACLILSIPGGILFLKKT